MDPRFNLRDDRYGGSFEKSAHRWSTCSGACAAKSAALLGLRVRRDEIDVAGPKSDDTSTICQTIEGLDLVDYFQPQLRPMCVAERMIHVVPPMAVEAATSAGMPVRSEHCCLSR
jgi:2,4-dienoyl-CoA reductase-like NADH-dependent reductase (Old Yellow Enzyme family)